MLPSERFVRSGVKGLRASCACVASVRTRVGSLLLSLNSAPTPASYHGMKSHFRPGTSSPEFPTSGAAAERGTAAVR
eukprot:7276244-Prymnesium_polylepis.1